jgi:hypothetical protein
MFCFGTTYRSLKSMDTAKYFQNGLTELVKIWHTEMFKFLFLEQKRSMWGPLCMSYVHCE